MNNLKRVLSLGLSGVMLAGLLTVGASAADFTDAEDIQHNEAVNVLCALEIIDGKPDGSFAPEETVTRSQMAKMIAVAMNGGSETNTGVKTTPSFTDIKGHWAESYIEYCADLGIISGRGDGTFDPDATVTAIEATKMVLTAMGFDAEAYKLNGAKWATRTDEVARTMTGLGWYTTEGSGSSATTTYHGEPNMYDELAGVVMAAPATRDTAAQLIWNGLQNRTRTVQPTTTDGGGTEWTYITNSATLLNQRYSANVYTGTFSGNYYTGATSTKGEIKVNSWTFPYDLDISNIGEEVKIIWKDGTRGTKGRLDSKDVIYGVFNTGASVVVNSIKGNVKDQKSDKAQINIDGTTYDTANRVTVVTNYMVSAGKSYSAINGSDKGDGANSALTEALKGKNGDTIKAIIDPDSDKIETIYVTTSEIAAVTAVNSSKVSINNGVGALTIDGNDLDEDLKRGDVVVVTTLYQEDATDEDAYTIVRKAETVEGEVKGYKKNETVKLDDTNYKIKDEAAKLFTSIPDVSGKIVESFNDGSNSENTVIGEDVTLYMVNGYVGAAVQTSESATNYSLILEVKADGKQGSAFDVLQLQVMDGEGTKSIITVSDDSDNYRDKDGKLFDSEDDQKDDKSGITAADYKVGDIITYTMDGSEAVVTVEAPVDNDNTGAYSDSTKSIGKNGEKLTVTIADCVVFVQTAKDIKQDDDKDATDMFWTGASYKAYKVRDLDSFSSSLEGVTLAYNNNDKVVAAFINLGKKPNGATSNTIYGIITAATGRVKDYYAYTVQANGEEYTVNSKDGSLAKGDLVFFDQTADDNYNKGDVKVVTGATENMQAVYVKEHSEKDGTLTFYTTLTKDGNAWKGSVASQVTLALDEDCVIVYVDKDGTKSAAESSIEEFDSVNGYKNAAIVTETTELADGSSETKIVAIYAETSNKCDILDDAAVILPEGADLDTILDAPNGVYTTEDEDFFTNNSLSLNGSADPTKVRIFKFDTLDTGVSTDYTLTIKNSAKKVVVTEKATDDKGEAKPAIVYVATDDPSYTGGAATDAWATGALEGTFTYEIKAEWTETVKTTDEDGNETTETVNHTSVVSSGEFSIAAAD